jgi:hypothetical protein
VPLRPERSALRPAKAPNRQLDRKAARDDTRNGMTVSRRRVNLAAKGEFRVRREADAKFCSSGTFHRVRRRETVSKAAIDASAVDRALAENRRTDQYGPSLRSSSPAA